jgi:hypothetical protein
VAIACDVNAVDMTASASTPGVTKSTRENPCVSRSMNDVRTSANRTRTGSTIVTSSCSPLRRIARVSKDAWAAIRRTTGAAAGSARSVGALIAGAFR